MSTTTSIRRIKERGGSVGKIAPSIPTKTLTPSSERSSSVTSGRKTIGKENPKPRSASVSRVTGATQKPVIRSMPRVSDAEPRSRSRGRRSPSPNPCSNPSDFTRILSDMRKTRVASEVSSVKGVNGFRVLDKKGFRDLNQKVSGSRVSVDGREYPSAGKVSVSRKDDNLSCVHSVKLNVNNLSDGCVNESVKNGSFSAREAKNVNQSVDLKTSGGSNMEKSGLDGSFKGLSVRISGSDVSREKGVSEEGTSGRVANKHASKLHEKLAYLEGKVKRIATDIKKTKEMLDMNNTDASKMILSDIQEKISGIEKAMGNVMADSKEHVSMDCSSNSGYSKNTEIDQNATADSMKVSAKGYSCEELEARLFPHHKLLKNRTTLVSDSGSQSDGTYVLEPNGGSNSKEDSGSPVDEDPIAMAFLASLSKTQSKVGVKDVEVTLDSNKVQEADDAETSTARRSSEVFSGKSEAEPDLEADEKLDEIEDQENKPEMVVDEEMDDDSISQLIEIGRKTSTGGWFVAEGESVLLAHDDGSCSFYDIANNEVCYFMNSNDRHFQFSIRKLLVTLAFHFHFMFFLVSFIGICCQLNNDIFDGN